MHTLVVFVAYREGSLKRLLFCHAKITYIANKNNMFESFFRKKEKPKFEITADNTQLFEEWYAVNDESAFNENVRAIAHDLNERAHGNPVDEEVYVETLRAIKDFAEEEGASFADLSVIEAWIAGSKLMEEISGDEKLQTYLLDSPLKDVE